MRVLIGIILGAIITVGGAYLYDFEPCGDEFRQRNRCTTSHGELGCRRQQMEPSHGARPRRMEPARFQDLIPLPAG